MLAAAQSIPDESQGQVEIGACEYLLTGPVRVAVFLDLGAIQIPNRGVVIATLVVKDKDAELDSAALQNWRQVRRDVNSSRFGGRHDARDFSAQMITYGEFTEAVNEKLQLHAKHGVS